MGGTLAFVSSLCFSFVLPVKVVLGSFVKPVKAAQLANTPDV